MKSFLVKSTVLTIVIFILGSILYQEMLASYYLGILPLVVLLFYAITNLVHLYLLKVAARSGGRFTARFMATSFLRMFFYLAVALSYAFVNKGQAKIFLINFLLLYLIYTTFEVVELAKVFRQKAK